MNECQDQFLGNCICFKPVGHEGPHVCECGGSWKQATTLACVSALKDVLSLEDVG